MGELIKITRLSDMPPATWTQEAGRWPSSTWLERFMLSVVHAPIEAVLWEKASWTGQWSLVHSTVLSAM